jgi:hypothetical protein
MNSFVTEPKAMKVEFRDESMWVELADGRTIGVPLAYFPRLLAATDEQRSGYIISGGGIGLHWEEIDEDILVAGLLLGVGDRTQLKSDRSPNTRKSAHNLQTL